MRLLLKRDLWLLLATLLLSFPAQARMEFFATLNGERLAGTQVCFSAAGEPSRYFVKFMGDGTDVLCLSADEVIDLPVGGWNYFAYHERGYVSPHPGHITVSAISDHYSSTDVELVPAGVLDMAKVLGVLPASDEAVVYFPNNDQPRSPSAIRRFVPGSTRMYVPAGAQVLPLVIRSGVPVLAGDPVVVAQGETKDVPPLENTTTAIVPIQLSLPDDIWRSGAIVDPVVSARTADGTSLTPVIPLRRGTALERSLLIVHPPKGGPLRIRLEGPRWKATELRVEAHEGGVTAAGEPLWGIPAGELDLSWESTPEAAAIRHENPACPDVVQPAAVRLLRCADAADTKCTLFDELRPAPASGSRNYPSLDPGDYEVELAFPPLPAKRARLSIPATERRELREQVEALTVRGQVTRGRSFVGAARVDVLGKVVAVSELDGSYAIPVAGELRIVPVTVQACDDSFSFTTAPSAPIPAGSTFDIEIPDNRIEVTVVDKRTEKPLAGALATVAAEHPADPDASIFSVDAKADSRGVASFDSITTGFPVIACAKMPGYRQQCTASERLKASGVKQYRIELQSPSRSGRIVVDGRLVAASAYWVGAEGLVREEIYGIHPDDGTFRFDYSPVPGDYLVVVSQSHPLFVYRPESFETIDVRIPPATAQVTVAISSSYHRETATATITIGGRLVPAAAFAQHATWRGLSDLRRGFTYQFRGIVADGPLTVLFGPSHRDRPLDLPLDADIFALPPFAGLIDRRSVGPDGRVSF
jgi:hypothetical protein